MKGLRIWILSTGALVLCCPSLQGQWTFLSTYSNQEIQTHAQTALAFDDVTLSMLVHDVSMRRLSYEMPFLGEDISVSGAVFVPDAPDLDLPVLVYHHGTTFQRQLAPSFKEELTNLGFTMASLGFLVLMPDYVGLGESPLQHPYCHADSEADAGWFMVNEVVDLIWDLEVNLNGNLYVMGYSQGGHAAMAMARAEPPEPLIGTMSLKAAAPSSGPYDMNGVQLPWILGSPDYSQPAYIFYLLKGWNSVYGNLFDSFSDFCLAPYDGILNEMLDGEHSGDAINALCPDDWTDMLLPGAMESMTGMGSPLQLAAEANDVHLWSPSVPVHMRYCSEDEEVLFANATSAYDAMSSSGEEGDVLAYNLGAYSHNECALSAIASSVLWFLSLESTTDNTLTPEWNSGPCLEWVAIDAMGRLCSQTEALTYGQAGLYFKRCLETGHVEKWCKLR